MPTACRLNNKIIRVPDFQLCRHASNLTLRFVHAFPAARRAARLHSAIWNSADYQKKFRISKWGKRTPGLSFFFQEIL